MKSNGGYPKAGASKEIQKVLREILKRKPSEKLIRIIHENARLIDEEKSHTRYPKVGGLKRVRQNLKEITCRRPSEELIRVVNENNRIMDQEDRLAKSLKELNRS